MQDHKSCLSTLSFLFPTFSHDASYEGYALKYPMSNTDCDGGAGNHFLIFSGGQLLLYSKMIPCPDTNFLLPKISQNDEYIPKPTRNLRQNQTNNPPDSFSEWAHPDGPDVTSRSTHKTAPTRQYPPNCCPLHQKAMAHPATQQPLFICFVPSISFSYGDPVFGVPQKGYI